MGKQGTICFHVYDCKISHVNAEVIDDIISWLREEHESVYTDDSGKMKVAWDKVHKYLGMTFDFTTKRVVILTMIEYVSKACVEFDDGFKLVANCKRIAMAAPDNLFKVDEDAVKLGPLKAKAFHTTMAKALYVSKRARPNTSLAIAFLTTRVCKPDEDGWRKLCHIIVYLQSTRDLPLVLGTGDRGVLHWYVDASFAVHPNMKGHTGRVLTMGTGCPLVTSTKQKVNTHSSTISEQVAVDDMIAQILWTC